MSIAELKRLTAEVGEVLAKHETTRELIDFTKYAEDPAGFFRDVLHCEPWSAQLEMAERVRDNPRTVVVSANSIGKDWAVARIALFWVYARRGLVILSGPTERQVKQILMREVRRAFSIASDLPGELYAMELRVDEDSGIIAMTSDNSDKLTGFHNPRLLICFTEAQGVADESFEAAFACCTAPGNRIFAYGNPTRISGRFHEAATSDNWSLLTIKASDHPNVVNGNNDIPGGISREWIATMAEEYGATSSIYRSRVLAAFPDENIEGLLKRSWLRAAFDRHDSKEMAEGGWFHRPIISVDVARFGPDSSVLAIIRGPVVEELITWHHADLYQSADKVIAQAERLTVREARPKFADTIGRPRIIVDDEGVGGGLTDILKRKGWGVTAFKGSNRALDPAKYLNMRAQSHWRLRELLEQNKIALPRDTMLEEEALAVEWQIVPRSGAIQIVGKDLIRKTLKRSPDRLDAVVMGLAHGIGHLSHMASYMTLQY